MATEVTINGDKITPPKNYLIGKITKVDNGMLVEFVKKQSQYPKTYEECCQHLGCDDKLNVGELIPFQQLVNARNAYWKIAGKEMGLDRHWEPDWSNDDETKFCIYTTQNMISLDIFGVDNRILAFPTEEMRDAFYENFKDLIKNVKELL